MTDDRRTRYAKTRDGVHIAYQAAGAGTRDIVLVPGFATNVEHGRTEPSLVAFGKRLEGFARVIVLDKRGTGLSDRDVATATLEDRMEDVRAVMDHAGSFRATVFGVSEGAPMAMLFAATYPERVVSLVIYAGMAKWLATPDCPFGVPPEVFDFVIERTETHFGEGLPLEIFAPSVAGDPAVRSWWAEQERRSSSPGAMRTMLQMNAEIDVRAILPSIAVPTLVLHRTGDMVINVGQGRYLGATIPGARFVELPGVDHLPFYGDSAALALEIEAFVTGARPAESSNRVLATVLLTDIVSSTLTAAALGDQPWMDVLDRHDRIVKEALQRHRGRLVNSTGDGMLAIFDGPGRAIRCATEICRDVAALGIQIRAGVHTGEIEIRGDDVGGIAVHICARVANAAAPDEVLVSRTVVDLVAGSGIDFLDRGEHELKGVPGTLRLYAAGSPDGGVR